MRFSHPRLRAGMCLIALVSVATTAHAQRRGLTPRDVAQIADEALRVIVAPDSSLSGIPVAKRGIAFDVVGTLAAFRADTNATADFQLARKVTSVTRRILSDCSQIDPKPCAALGSRAFVTMSPLSVTGSHAHVRVNVEWSVPVHLDADTTVARHAFLTGFAATIHLARSASGRWIFVKQDRTVTAA